MFWLERFALAALICAATAATAADTPKLGQAATPADLAAWDISIPPDGAGLPPGKGTSAQGEAVYASKCLGCHGEKGAGKPNDVLVGGTGSLAGGQAPVKTVGSYWPYATTLYDYIHRAMPYQAPGSLSNDEYYSLAAYIFSLNGILPEDGKLDHDSLPKIKMPNHDGFVPDPNFDPAKLFRTK